MMKFFTNQPEYLDGNYQAAPRVEAPRNIQIIKDAAESTTTVMSQTAERPTLAAYYRTPCASYE